MQLEKAETSYSRRVLGGILEALRPVRPYWDDPAVDEIQINGENDVFVRKSGRDVKVDIELSSPAIRSAINMIASYNDKEMGDAKRHFILSARLPGVRVEAMLPPVSLRGPSMCLRKHATRVVPLSEYVDKEICTEDQARLMTSIVESNTNFMVSGGTYSGKTTLVNALLGIVPKDQRLFTIEQVAELRLESPNFASLECDPEQGITAQRALQVGMRYSPHRIILGELRGPEAVDFLMACNTGHPGSCTTIHADSAKDALSRLEDLVLMANRMPYEALRARIGQSISWVIQIQMHGGQRRITEIVKVCGYDRTSETYVFENHTEGVSK
ncbi:ATPase, T2SS/T4P/T4SS family [Acidovorax sp.]|uniref:CpaF family protein n=1 Tax=Acidovorax sp. TaxID=1872122 RepID=UPI0025BAB572|nr:ATPase, T2SS/T4P/T4SS family [Acidovorax sp.]